MGPGEGALDPVNTRLNVWPESNRRSCHCCLTRSLRAESRELLRIVELCFPRHQLRFEDVTLTCERATLKRLRCTPMARAFVLLREGACDSARGIPLSRMSTVSISELEQVEAHKNRLFCSSQNFKSNAHKVLASKLVQRITTNLDSCCKVGNAVETCRDTATSREIWSGATRS